MPYLPVLIAVAAAVLFVRAAQYERLSTVAWGGASIALSAIVISMALGTAWLILVQVALFGVMWWVNAQRKSGPRA